MKINQIILSAIISTSLWYCVENVENHKIIIYLVGYLAGSICVLIDVFGDIKDD